MLEPQEMFDLVVLGMYEQKGPSYVNINDGLMCLYRNENNCRKCPAGILLPDSEYKKEFETLTVKEIEWFSKQKNLDFIYNMQEIHDSIISGLYETRGEVTDEQFLDQFRTSMIQLAIEENLSIDVFLKINF